MSPTQAAADRDSRLYMSACADALEDAITDAIAIAYGIYFVIDSGNVVVRVGPGWHSAPKNLQLVPQGAVSGNSNNFVIGLRLRWSFPKESGITALVKPGRFGNTQLADNSRIHSFNSLPRTPRARAQIQ